MTLQLIYLITFINFVGLLYLTFLVYKKNQIKSKAIGSSASPNSEFKISLTRFNPFDDVGGDQSFILCLLDKTDSGVIITSLHHRDLTRVYAKTVKQGAGENATLSSEEKMALSKLVVKD